MARSVLQLDLDAILAPLLAPLDDYYEISRSIESLGRALDEATGFAGRNQNRAFERFTVTEYGKAIAPDAAAACLREQIRTRRFFQGVDAALRAADRMFPGETIQILYAGCGPYALLALPVLAAAWRDRAQLTLIDLHGESLQAAERALQAFGRDPRTCGDRFRQGDAVSFAGDASGAESGGSGKYHILICETMNRALLQEPQTAVVGALEPLLHPQALLVPEEVRVEAVLSDARMEGRIRRGDLTHREALAESIVAGEVVRLNRRTAPELYANRGRAGLRFLIPEVRRRRHRLQLRTWIGIFDCAEHNPTGTTPLGGDAIELYAGQCSLTLPERLTDLNGPEYRRALELNIEYILDDCPHYRWNIADPGAASELNSGSTRRAGPATP